jgi:hypothetical protein
MMMGSAHVSDKEEARQLADKGWRELQRRKANGDYK